MNKFTRRDFLRTSLATTASLSLVPAWAAEGKKKKEVSAASQTAVAGANSDLRYAVVGFGTRGGAHLSGMGSIEGARLVALCDVDSKSLEREMSRCEKKGSKVEGYTDIRPLVGPLPKGRRIYLLTLKP